MLDFFSIFSKGGIVLWCFQGTSQLFTPSVNALIRTVILQERGGNNSFNHDGLTLQYKLDNEFELVFVVAYQKILQLSYVDKFLDDIQLEFRDKFKQELMGGLIFGGFSFDECYQSVVRDAEEWAKSQQTAPKKMRTFDESLKSKKTVASMIESRKEDHHGAGRQNQKKEKAKENKKMADAAKAAEDAKRQQEEEARERKAALNNNHVKKLSENGGILDEDTLFQNRKKLMEKKQAKNGNKPASKEGKSKESKPKGKQARIWDNGGTNKDAAILDFSKGTGSDGDVSSGEQDLVTDESRGWVGQMKGDLKGIDYESESDIEDESEGEEEEVTPSAKGRSAVANGIKCNKSSQKSGFGVFNMFRGLVGSKQIARDDIQPALDKLKEHMIGKNVASGIAEQMCDSVATKLEGRVLGTFSTVASTVRSTLNDSLVQLLSPRRRIDILRDIIECQKAKRPYTVTFCGVNGVGKSTNLAKIAFWLIENNFRVLIAACDTFRAGAVEQLRTHTRHLNALHPPERHAGLNMVQLYEKGYGKDAAGIAMEAVNYARDTRTDVVLIDTAGRMQDNEPLMRALAKLIKVNRPDLVLFVGEALVGNEAVDQLVKFNQALADHSAEENPHLIDGIVLTKFDTIDDKVGAAISMTHITGQPIVFVGTGQTYTDLKNLNAKAVVQALMK